MSIFAGALSDKWNKKNTMLVCDSLAALSTVSVLILLQTENLQIWHLYCINAVNGLMNTVQKPAADVSVSLLTPQKHYQKVSGLQSFSNSLISILTPMIATPVLAFWGMKAVIFFDLLTFAIAFICLTRFVEIPQIERVRQNAESVLSSAKSGLRYLKHNRGILDLIFFLAAINLTASVYNAVLPAMLLSRNGGSETALGIVNTVTGLAMLSGSIIISFLPAPKSRVRVICNTLQFFTIPIGYFIGGILVDQIFEPFMASKTAGSLLSMVFGQGKGSGAALLFFVIAIVGVISCLIFRRDPHIWELEQQ